MSDDHPHAWRDEVMATIKYKGLAPKHVRPIVWTDCEFTGFHKSAQIIDVAAIKLMPSGVVDIFESKIHLDDYARASAQKEALDIIGYNDEEWANAPKATEVMPMLFQHMQGATLVGHNLEADVARMRSSWEGLGITVPPMFCFPMICTEVLARAMLPGLEAYTLAALCQHYGIPEETQHRALGGAERARSLWTRLTAND